MRTTLIFLGSLAVILAIVTYFAVFGSPTGSYAVTPLGNASNTFTSSTFPYASSTPSSTPVGGGNASSSTAVFGTAFTTPALIWHEGQSTISITAVALSGNQMTFTMIVQTSASPECVPLNLRLVADEQGDLDPPIPASFSFPGTNNCNGAPNQTYTNQTTTFTIDPTKIPLLFTTGGSSSIFFEVVTSTNNGLNVVFPGTSG